MERIKTRRTLNETSIQVYGLTLKDIAIISTSFSVGVWISLPLNIPIPFVLFVTAILTSILIYSRARFRRRYLNDWLLYKYNKIINRSMLYDPFSSRGK